MKSLLLFTIVLFTNFIFAQAEINFERLQSLSINQDLDSVVLSEIYDSLSADYNESSMSIYEGQVHHSPDSLFRIYSFEGEGCGAYCNPFWEVFWAWKDPSGIGLKIEEAIWIRESIDSIVMLNKSHYLLLGNSYGRARSIESVECRTAKLIEFTDSIEVIWKFEVCTSNLASESGGPISFEYNKKKMQLDYNYDWYEEEPKYRLFNAEGSWQYDGKNFNKNEEKRTYYKAEFSDY